MGRKPNNPEHVGLDIMNNPEASGPAGNNTWHLPSEPSSDHHKSRGPLGRVAGRLAGIIGNRATAVVAAGSLLLGGAVGLVAVGPPKGLGSTVTAEGKMLGEAELISLRQQANFQLLTAETVISTDGIVRMTKNVPEPLQGIANALTAEHKQTFNRDRLAELAIKTDVYVKASEVKAEVRRDVPLVADRATDEEKQLPKRLTVFVPSEGYYIQTPALRSVSDEMFRSDPNFIGSAQDSASVMANMIPVDNIPMLKQNGTTKMSRANALAASMAMEAAYRKSASCVSEQVGGGVAKLPFDASLKSMYANVWNGFSPDSPITVDDVDLRLGEIKIEVADSEARSEFDKSIEDAKRKLKDEQNITLEASLNLNGDCKVSPSVRVVNIGDSTGEGR